MNDPESFNVMLTVEGEGFTGRNKVRVGNWAELPFTVISDTEGTFMLPKYINISSLNNTNYGDYKTFIEIGVEGLSFSNSLISYNYFE